MARNRSDGDKLTMYSTCSAGVCLDARRASRRPRLAPYREHATACLLLATYYAPVGQVRTNLGARSKPELVSLLRAGAFGT